MRLNVCVNDMEPFGPFAAIIQGKTHFDSDGSKGGCPQGELADPPGTNMFLIDRDMVSLKVSCLFVQCFLVWCVIGGGEICSESSARVRSTLGAGKVRNPVFLVCVGLV